jgi:succinoglycan biosynthesis transport protein ExoP
VDLRDWLAMLRRYWRSIAALALVGVLLGVVLTAVSDKAWTSSAQLMFTPAGHSSGDGQELAYSGQYVTSRMKTYERLATSASVLDSAAESIGRPAWATPDEVEASWEPETTLLTVEATAPGAADAQAYAAALAESVIAAVERTEAAGDDKGGAPAVVGTVVSPAEEPGSPASPRALWNVMGGAVLGLLAGLAQALLRRLTGPREP